MEWEVWEAWVQWLREWLAWLGRFSKTLEFGTAAFPGSAAWHEDASSSKRFLLAQATASCSMSWIEAPLLWTLEHYGGVFVLACMMDTVGMWTMYLRGVRAMSVCGWRHKNRFSRWAQAVDA